MSWMSPNMQMQTAAGGFKRAMGRLFSGESIFLNEFTAVGGSGMITFASTFPGSIMPYEITPGNGIIVQKTGFLAMEKGLDMSIYFQKKLSRGFFGGEGFIMQKISGSGLAFIEIDGHCQEYELAAGQTIVVSTGHLAAMTEGCTMDVEMIQGARNVFFGGEGLFHTRVTGPGKVWLQSMPIADVANAISPYLPQVNSSDSGGINIRLGD
jgi:uncharacterized protein (TIGR00266 family)